MALKWLRDNLKSLSWVLWGVVGVFILLVFFEWGGVNSSGAGRGNDIAATVGSEVVTFGEFQQQYRNLENYYQQTFGEQFSPDLAKRLNLHAQALNQLIDNKILLLEAQDIGLSVTDGEVQDAILSFPVFTNDAGKWVGEDEYKRILRANNWTSDSFEAQMRRDLMLGKLDKVLGQTAFVSEAEVEQAYREQAEQAKIRFVQLAASDLAAEDVAVDEAAVTAHFEANRTEYQIPEHRKVEYLLVDIGKMRQELQVDEEEMRAFYDRNQDDFTRKEQIVARHILRKVTPDRPEGVAEAEALDVKNRLEAGEDFAALAQEMSEDTVSARNGGDLQPFGRGEMVPQFEQAAFAAEPGTIVGPVKTDFGYHLIEVKSKSDGGLQPFEEVQDLVRARLVGERVNELAETKAQDLAKRLADAEGDDRLQAMATEEGLTVESPEEFSRTETIPGIGRSPSFNDAAFELEVGAVSEAVRIPRGFAILQLKEIIGTRLPELAEVEDRVRAAAENEARKSAALTKLQEAKVRLGAASLDDLSAELNVEVQESDWIRQGASIPGLGVNREITDAALSMDAGQVGEPIASAQGAVLFEVTERKSFDATEFEEVKTSKQQELQAERLNQLKQSLIDVRRRDLSPQVVPQVLESFEIDASAFGS